jgi:hypothetical protein
MPQESQAGRREWGDEAVLARVTIMAKHIPQSGAAGQEDSEKNPRDILRPLACAIAAGTIRKKCVHRRQMYCDVLTGGRRRSGFWCPTKLLLAGAWLVCLAGCSGDLGEKLQSGQVLAWHGMQGRWVGPVVPIDRSCGSPTQGLMSIGANGFGFDPFQSTTVLHGELSKDGRLAGNLAREGGDHQSLAITFAGEAAGSEAINGTLQSGRCRWTVALRRG